MAESRFEPVPFPDIPFAADVRAYCLDLPDAWEDYPWGDIVFKVGLPRALEKQAHSCIVLEPLGLLARWRRQSLHCKDPFAVHMQLLA